jgi:predicted nucleic acid-binding protein
MKQMSDRVFLDTNILIYVYSQDEPLKRDSVEKIIDNSDEIFLSTQVVNEFVNVMHKKRKVPLSKLVQTIDELREHFYIAQITIHTIKQAMALSARYKYSYFDSLILSSALEHTCSIVYTEDMHHTHVIENNLMIKNPF